jgi:hypothetical protein
MSSAKRQILGRCKICLLACAADLWPFDFAQGRLGAPPSKEFYVIAGGHSTELVALPRPFRPRSEADEPLALTYISIFHECGEVFISGEPLKYVRTKVNRDRQS